ncbi:GTP cyclohydrolase I FolE [Brachybacterium sp. DNPG3]
MTGIRTIDERPIRREVDTGRIERAVLEILWAIGEDSGREGIRDTPRRVARAYEEAFSGLHENPEAALGTVFQERYRDLVIVRDIRVSSFCKHHLLPFSGKASVGYIPGASGAVVGLSKLSRMVDVFARRPQVQERLTSQVADALVEFLAAEGVIVVIECEHVCMSVRGVRKPESNTVTSALRGSLRSDPQKQSATVNLIRSGA